MKNVTKIKTQVTLDVGEFLTWLGANEQSDAVALESIQDYLRLKMGMTK